MMNTLPCRRRSSHQRGAAMVEFVVIAIFVLVPMYLAVQAIGKVADVRSTTNSAARYSAWERTVWGEDTASDFYKHNKPNQKTAAQIHNEMLVRVLNDRSAAFKYKNTDKAATTFANGIDPMWQDDAGTDFLDDPAKVVMTASFATPSKDLLGAAIGLINAISVPKVTGTLAPPVPTKTMAVATVNFNKVGEKSEVYKRLWNKSSGLPTDWEGLDFTATGAVMSNTWASNASSGTKDMVSSSVPTASGLGTAVEVATKAVMAAWDTTEFPRLDLGRVAVDVTPPDRLK
jgi:Flp pilus assembly protein TadG